MLLALSLPPVVPVLLVHPIPLISTTPPLAEQPRNEQTRGRQHEGFPCRVQPAGEDEGGQQRMRSLLRTQPDSKYEKRPLKHLCTARTPSVSGTPTNLSSPCTSGMSNICGIHHTIPARAAQDLQEGQMTEDERRQHEVPVQRAAVGCGSRTIE